VILCRHGADIVQAARTRDSENRLADIGGVSIFPFRASRLPDAHHPTFYFPA
jgi:hypothetical protein